ncbi:hypothetical protein chiPu_0017768 [Chiloscyllium punctatum]|uniref:Uncharacterized protein n=1 Tax=Chiloscyllium punctatum TaxID=137246 RepID=A0A401RIS5_CHIPU|nr:hypothetical protein [Chiloscyllium punctatum]
MRNTHQPAPGVRHFRMRTTATVPGPQPEIRMRTVVKLPNGRGRHLCAASGGPHARCGRLLEWRERWSACALWLRYRRLRAAGSECSVLEFAAAAAAAAAIATTINCWGLSPTGENEREEQSNKEEMMVFSQRRTSWEQENRDLIKESSYTEDLRRGVLQRILEEKRKLKRWG